MAYHTPGSTVLRSTGASQRAIERPSSGHAVRRRLTRDDSAPYSFGSYRNYGPSPDRDEEEFAHLFEAGLGFDQPSGRVQVAESSDRLGGLTDNSTFEDGTMEDEDVEEGDDELSVEDDGDGEWTPSYPIRADRHDPAQPSTTQPSNSTHPPNSRPQSSALLGLRNQPARDPDRHSHAGRDSTGAAHEVTVAARAVKNATTLVSQDKARANWIQLWSVIIHIMLTWSSADRLNRGDAG